MLGSLEDGRNFVQSFKHFTLFRLCQFFATKKFLSNCCEGSHLFHNLMEFHIFSMPIAFSRLDTSQVLGVFKENLKEDVVVFTTATSSGDSVDTLLPETSHTLLASSSATISRVLGVLSDEALLTTCGALHTEVVHTSFDGSSCATSLGLNSMDLVLDSSLL